jgi:hypothetical protein
MKINFLTFLFVAATAGLFASQASADNTLSQEQLIKATQAAILDYSTVEAEMIKSLSGFKVSTVGPYTVEQSCLS